MAAQAQAAATPRKREPLRPLCSNASTPTPVAERRNRAAMAASKEKENERPEVAPPPPLKPSSLQNRMKAEEEKEKGNAESSPPAALVAGIPVRMGPRGRELLIPPPPPPPPPTTTTAGIPHSAAYEAWDLSDNEAAPASSWSTLPNRALLCRPLPLDVGRCTCVIAKEKPTAAGRGVAIYSLYTNEGQGRQDRKLAVARHRRRRGRSEFVVAQSQEGIFCGNGDRNFLGTLGANLVGSKYRIWGQGNRVDEIKTQSKRLLGVVAFAPTVTTLTGSFRSMRAWIPKNQSMQLKNSNSAQIQHIGGLPKDWQVNKIKADQLCSRSPFYNNMTKRYELDFRERAGRMGYKVQASVKNFQMTLEENGKQTVLQLGRIGKSKYIMDFRYPLTGYQAFCICLASIDSKLCCTL
uniref:Tubby C-terminal domain-containing protein n=1 Tax=Leersia perrieri TaxID=77586 RepID=A0A0D9VCY2_9ORYZ